MKGTDPRAPLLPNVSQYEVDFVIPRIGVDVPLGIDPFLLYKSRDQEFRELHDLLLGMFNAGIAAVRDGALEDAARIFDFPEVAAIGLGYASNSRRGSGVGSHIARLIIDTLRASPSLQERGVRHVEEMQLVSAGIGPDRISDITANVIKRYLINYTQRQCAIWNLPMTRGVPVTHIYNHATQAWEDAYEDLPVSTADGSPILLVPRRLVRVLPWINYDDFVRTEFNAYLASRRQAAQKARVQQGRPAAPTSTASLTGKRDVTVVTRADIGLIERYVRSREAEAANAHPAMEYKDEDACRDAATLKERLAALPPGRDDAADYQRLILEILNFLFIPELIDGKPEVRTIDGTERRDIIFTNDSDETFWDYVRTTHDSITVMFEAKNTDELDLAAINQTATYLGDRIGRLGIIVTRQNPPEPVRRKIFSVWNDSAPNRKVILTLCDDQVRELLDLRCKNASPTKWMQKHYRAFRTAVQ